jgi:hypothetical protein
MAQIPALFLPKKSSEKKKTQTKVPQKQQKELSGPGKKVSALLKGRVDGYKENTSQIYRATRRREC